ncbi:hypothetical protein M0R72_07610 [Candidatus Pacearchaeota archaeon]|jgi:hypothetical protein|nr:hypothetical protein [Candidatus Pacearchaeota archaeon]
MILSSIELADVDRLLTKLAEYDGSIRLKKLSPGLAVVTVSISQDEVGNPVRLSVQRCVLQKDVPSVLPAGSFVCVRL